MKPCLIIRNPAAGRGRALKQWDAVARKLRDAGTVYDEVVTHRPWEASEIAEREAGNYERIIAAGGDGTVHEVMNGMMRAGSAAALGVLPLGTGNDFTKLLSSGVGVVDVSRISAGHDSRYFANGMDIGFGAHAARNLTRVPRFLTGFGAYLGALVLTLVKYPQLHVRIQLDDAPAFELTTAMTAVMNGTTFGGGFRVCPDARPDDSLLDLLLVGPVGRWEILQLASKIMSGAHTGDRRLRMLRTRRLCIESSEPMLVETDGELAFDDARRLEIVLLPGALKVSA